MDDVICFKFVGFTFVDKLSEGGLLITRNIGSYCVLETL